jgi:hypothetical protein
MEQRLPTKKQLIDAMIAEATHGYFKGDKRDGETPPITVQNFFGEMSRHAARALRARLSRLSRVELFTEAFAAADYAKARQEQSSQIVELADGYEREEAAQVLRQRQAELGRRPRLQSPILAAARHYRGHGASAGEAWDALCKTPFKTEDGHTVKVEGPKLSRLEQRMRVISRDGRQQKRAISFEQWRKNYWKNAKPG